MARSANTQQGNHTRLPSCARVNITLPRHHNYIDHYYRGHNYIGHNYIGHNKSRHYLDTIFSHMCRDLHAMTQRADNYMGHHYRGRKYICIYGMHRERGQPNFVGHRLAQSHRAALFFNDMCKDRHNSRCILHSYGLCSYGIYMHGLCSYGMYSYGL